MWMTPNDLNVSIIEGVEIFDIENSRVLGWSEYYGELSSDPWIVKATGAVDPRILMKK